MKANEYKVLVQAIESGVAYGYHRAYKHNDDPGEDAIKDAITEAVINEVCEWFEFEQPVQDEPFYVTPILNDPPF